MTSPEQIGGSPLPEPNDEFRERLDRAKREHIGVLNRLESHLGCVVCHGPLTDGRCPTCQLERSSQEAPNG